MNKCLYCKKDISMDIEFGNPNLCIEGFDGDGFTCSKKCHENYKNKISKQMDVISKMNDKQFYNYMGGKI